MKVSAQLLDSAWRMREVPPEGLAAHQHLPWLPAQVPGSVHLDLMHAGVIPNPFYRMQEHTVAWVDARDWIYETTFTLTDPLPSYTLLRFEDLDTIAEISLNGRHIGTTDSMFIAHEFPVTNLLQFGDNDLQITFRSASRIGLERRQAWDNAGNDTLPTHWDNWANRAFVRKAQYMYGWDWGPVLNSCGIGKPVQLITIPTARLTHWNHSVTFADDGTALVAITADIERSPNQENTELIADLNLSGSESLSLSVPWGTGHTQVMGTLRIENPKLWWPNGFGEQPLYDLTIELKSANETIDNLTAKLGLRTIELIRERDADDQGEGFQFRVNGVDIYAKGANWIPEHSFPSLITPERVRERITQARDAHFTMLRVWGGGFYESDVFYQTCDEMGILVWQDFLYACSYYPDTGEFAEAARLEATSAVRRLRNHASLALWCGNNENHTMFEGNWTRHAPPRLIGEHLYHNILPGVLEIEDAKTPYWPGSPWNGSPGNANSDDFGDAHNWDVWHGRGDWKHYTESKTRFCSEFGFASSCGLAAWDTCLAPEDRDPRSPVVRWHDKTRKGYDTYLGMIGLHYPEINTLEDLVYYSQCNQAEALTYGVEHYRRSKGRNWGALFWQLNDCWPTQSWSIIDSLGEPKAAYFASKRFFAPLLLSLVREDQTVTAHLVSDLLTSTSGLLTWTLETFSGQTLATESVHVTIEANATSIISSFNLAECVGREREIYLHASFTAPNGRSTENFLFLSEPKEWQIPEPSVCMRVTECNEEFAITLKAQTFAPYAWLHCRDNATLAGLSDNFFHLRPGETYTVMLEKTATLQTAEDLRQRLTVRLLSTTKENQPCHIMCCDH